MKFFSQKTKQTNLEKLLDLFYHGKYKETIENAELILKNDSKNLNVKRIAGLANYKIRRFENAVTLFKEIAETSNITDDWFNLCTSATRNNLIELSEFAFNKFFDETSIKGENSMLSYPNVLYQYMIALKDMKHYNKALEKLIALKKYYGGLQKHNDDFLGNHAIPFIFTTLVSSKEILDNVYTLEQINNWLADFAKQVDEYGKESIIEFKQKHYPQLV